MFPSRSLLSKLGLCDCPNLQPRSNLPLPTLSLPTLLPPPSSPPLLPRFLLREALPPNPLLSLYFFPPNLLSSLAAPVFALENVNNHLLSSGSGSSRDEA